MERETAEEYTHGLDHLPALTAGVVGKLYLLCFDEAISGEGGARHYLGWSSAPEARLAEHRRGHGAALTREANRRGVGYAIVRQWEGKTRADEASMKNGGSLARFCPDCRAAWLAKRNRQQQLRRKKDGRADRPRGNPRGPLRRA